MRRWCLYQSRRCLLSHAAWSHGYYVSAAQRGLGAWGRVGTYWDRADEEAPRGEVEVLRRRMLLHPLVEHANGRIELCVCRIPASVP